MDKRECMREGERQKREEETREDVQVLDERGYPILEGQVALTRGVLGNASRVRAPCPWMAWQMRVWQIGRSNKARLKLMSTKSGSDM